MSAIRVTGIEDFKKKLQRLDASVKRTEVQNLLVRVAQPTVRVAKTEAPVSSGYIEIGGKRYKRKTRQAGSYKYPGNFTPGLGKKSISAKVLKRADEPMVSVGPHSENRATDGFYMRRFVIPGHNIYRKDYKRSHRFRSRSDKSGVQRRVLGNPFIDRTYQLIKKQASEGSSKELASYVQDRIDALSDA